VLKYNQVNSSWTIGFTTVKNWTILNPNKLKSKNTQGEINTWLEQI